MRSATVRTVTGATVMAAVASAMLLAIGGDSGTPSRFELVTETASEGAEPAAGPALGAPPAEPVERPGSAASPVRRVH
jgi:hypothetical protein